MITIGSKWDFYILYMAAKGNNTLTNQILRFYDDYVSANLTFQKIHFFIYTLISKKGVNLILLNIIQILL